jgi:DMSO/TMAO reductase YedYZ molybdopterin-dependent catalytic subunit
LSAAAALGVAELVAAVLGGDGSPVLAVGGAFVDSTPRWLKEFAIDTFGHNDKNALLVGISITIAILAAAIGVLAQWFPRAGVAAAALLGLVPAAAAVSRPTGETTDAMPSIVGAAVGAGFVWWFTRNSGDASRDGGSEGSGTGLTRRSFMLAGVAAGVIAVTSAVVARALLHTRANVEALRTALRLPTPSGADAANPAPADLDVAGISTFTTPNSEFYRVDTALAVPYVDPDTWRLRIHGMVDNERSYSLRDLLAMPLIERDVTLTCVSNEVGGDLVGNARWLGVPLAPLLADVGPAADADQVVSRSVDGMSIGTPTQTLIDGRDAMLAVGMNGEPLPIEHGFPVRMVVPGLYGYVSACKWITEMEFTTFTAYDAYWVKRGWVQQAAIKLSSRIDTPQAGARVAGPVPVGGVAWAQNIGVKRVDVRVDDGDWQPALLGGDGGVDSWRQWTWVWEPASSGDHTLQVRAVDRNGDIQSGEPAAPFPSGSTGWHSVDVTVT